MQAQHIVETDPKESHTFNLSWSKFKKRGIRVKLPLLCPQHHTPYHGAVGPVEFFVCSASKIQVMAFSFTSCSPWSSSSFLDISRFPCQQASSYANYHLACTFRQFAFTTAFHWISSFARSIDQDSQTASSRFQPFYCPWPRLEGHIRWNQSIFDNPLRKASGTMNPFPATSSLALIHRLVLSHLHFSPDASLARPRHTYDFLIAATRRLLLKRLWFGLWCHFISLPPLVLLHHVLYHQMLFHQFR